MSTITLTQDQQRAYEEIAAFIAHPTQQVHVLKGYSGTGKSTLVKYLLADLPKLLKMFHALNPQQPEMDVHLAATTNKAADNLQFITGQPVRTLQSLLNLRVQKSYDTGESYLVPRKGASFVEDALIVADEASYIDRNLLDLHFKQTRNCKTLFIGDPAQLTPVKSAHTPVFAAGFPTSELKEVVRQEKDSPILELATAFRETVLTGEFFSFVPDGTAVAHKSREAFEEEVKAEFTSADWSDRASKVLAWTNKTVVGYNRGISNLVSGNPDLQPGDQAVCNSYISNTHCRLRTDQLVTISKIEPEQQLDTPGFNVTFTDGQFAFMPADVTAKPRLIKKFAAQNDHTKLRQVSDYWIDLRAAFSCTINKSQGSTYKKVFIDLDDIKRCRNPNQLARMLYVGVSRATDRVVFTGDIA